METFSTVLFVNHAPVGYSVRRGPDHAELNPAENPTRTQAAPALIARKCGGDWQVQGTSNPELIRQVLEELQLTGLRSVDDVLSAAP